MRSEFISQALYGRLPGLLVTILLTGLLLGMFTLGGCRSEAETEEPVEVLRNVRVLALEKIALTEYFEIAGPIRPVRGTDVSAEEAGTVASIPHDKGTRVAKGATLIELDRRLLQAEMESARANLAAAEYNFDKT